MQQTKLFFPLPLDIKTYLEETFGVKVNQVVFTYDRKDIAKIESKLKSVEKSLEYCKRYPNTKLWSCRTSTESALKYYEKLGWHFISSIFRLRWQQRSLLILFFFCLFLFPCLQCFPFLVAAFSS